MILKNGKVLRDNNKFEICDILIRDKKIEGIGNYGEVLNKDVIDLDGMTVLPGFIETHFHGGRGYNFSDADADIKQISDYVVKSGVTTYTPTTAAEPLNHLEDAFRHIAEYKKNNSSGVKIAGIHAEGPFLSPKRCGSMKIDNMCLPTKENFDRLYDASEGNLKIITIAPEIPGGYDVIERAVQKGVAVSVGHSDATYDEAKKAVDLGATRSTHTFNAMRPFNHREPGILGMVLTDNRISCEMIADFTHISKTTVEIIYKLKGCNKINLISDGSYLGGTASEGDDVIAHGVKSKIRNGVIVFENGTISGSVATILKGVKNLYSMGIPLEEISIMASKNPAKSLGINRETGSITEGKYADLVVLDDNLDVAYTIINGEIEYKR